MENNFIRWGIFALLLLATELLYFKIAERFTIIDRPNERSSHRHPIIRGGGIIFLMAVLLWFFETGEGPWFVLATVIVAVISFLDDITSLNVRVRFFFQFVALGLLFYQLWPLHWPVYFLVLAVPFCVGTINAFNFMDGINGITGVYALVMLGTFAVINQLLPFTDTELLMMVALSVLIFLFFNFRTTARCFAGDVGSVSMALILIFILLQLINTTGNFLWPLLFLVYGTDSLVTIFSRLKRKENIFTPHRTHLYQYLTNELSYSHVVVSSAYGMVQVLINAIVVYSLLHSNHAMALAVALLFVMVYFRVRSRVLHKVQTVTAGR